MRAQYSADWAIAIFCDSKVIEIYGDKIRAPHGFESCRPLTFIEAAIDTRD